MTSESPAKFAIGRVHLNPSPINPNWILDGNPVSCNKVLSSSADGTASTVIWDCTAGRFNWFYGIDETLYVIEGSVVIKDVTGVARRLGVGDMVYFPAGSHAEWSVEDYVRKVAFCRASLPRPLVFAKRGYRLLKRVLGRGGDKDVVSAMFSAD
jgi:hypothetical protein